MTDTDIIEPDMTIRASSFATLFDCPARWEAIHINGKRTPSGAPAIIGSAMHQGATVFDSARLIGNEPSVMDSVDAAADLIRNPPYEVQWDDTRPGDAIDIAVRLTTYYCNEISPQYTYDKVEMSLDPLNIRTTNGIIIRITGTLDRSRVEGNKSGIVDFKTGARAVKSDGTVETKYHGAQLATYELLDLMTAATTGVEQLLPALVIALPTAGKQKPTAAPIYNPHKVLIGNAEHKGLIDHAAEMLKHGVFFGNPRSMLCHEKYCPIYKTCFYRFQGD